MSIDFAAESAVEITIRRCPCDSIEYWAKRTQAAELRVHDMQDAVRCAADYLRDGAPGRALEVLEANMR